MFQKNISFYKPLFLAIENGNLDIVKLLLSANDIDVNEIIYDIFF